MNQDQSKTTENFTGQKNLEGMIKKGETYDGSRVLRGYFKLKRIFNAHLVRAILIAVVVLVFLIAGYSIYQRSPQRSVSNSQPKKEVSIDIPKADYPIFITDTNGVSKATEDQMNNAMAESENYQLKVVAIGGDAVAISRESETSQLGISDVRSELLTTKSGDEAKLIISWHTNKLAKSKISYAKDMDDNKKILTEDDFGFSHMLVLSKFEQDTRYTYSISAEDRWGNEVSSEIFGAYTGKKIVSIFDLISSEIDEMFGWAIRK